MVLVTCSNAEVTVSERSAIAFKICRSDATIGPSTLTYLYGRRLRLCCAFTYSSDRPHAGAPQVFMMQSTDARHLHHRVPSNNSSTRLTPPAASIRDEAHRAWHCTTRPWLGGCTLAAPARFRQR